MNICLFSVVKKILTTNFKRNIHFVSNHWDKAKKQEEVESRNPFCLDPICTTSYTLKKHDNPRRQKLFEYGVYVAACLPKYVQKVQIQHTDELEILVAPEGIFQVLSFLCHHQNACFNQCSGVTALDAPSRLFRFEVIYCLLSLRYNERIRVKTYTDELTPIPSAYSLWKGVNWFEREVYDLFGVIFTGHPDLRRLLTDYGFTGHPMRKDFPLCGYIEVRYDDELKKIVYEPVEMAQEFRRYKIDSPWSYYRNFHEGYNGPPPIEKK